MNKNTKNQIHLLNSLSDKLLKFTYKEYLVKYVIMCEGNIFSNCLVIAEAPGALEEQYNRILIGKSGSLIRDILRLYGIENNVVYLNTVPWRPEKNKTPLLKDIKNYSSFWELLLEILNIEYILCLGSIAKKFTQINEKFLSKKVIFHTFHPSYYLRTKNPEHYRDIKNNVIYMKQFLKVTKLGYFHFVRSLI